jgi:predicted DNA-binding transcriptional regulator AlpA
MANIATDDLDVLVDLKTVCRALTRSRASIYRDIKRGTFPKPSKVGSSSRWRMSQVRAAIAAASPVAA